MAKTKRMRRELTKAFSYMAQTTNAQLSPVDHEELLKQPGWLFVCRHLMSLWDAAEEALKSPETHQFALGQLSIIEPMLHSSFLSERIGICSDKDLEDLEKVQALFDEINTGEQTA